MDHRVKKVIALMEEYLHREWPTSRLAQSVNISPSRLHQLFKDETGLPPARYLHSLRMRQARQLLETSYLSVKQVMAQIGVRDESHFVRDYKKLYGLTPAKYRERFMNGHCAAAAESHGLAPALTSNPPAPTSNAPANAPAVASNAPAPALKMINPS